MDRPWVLKQTTYTTKYVVATQQFTNSANSRHNRQFIRLQATTILLPDNSQLVNFQSPISIRTPTNTSYLFKCMLSTAQIYVPETTHTIAHTTAHCIILQPYPGHLYCSATQYHVHLPGLLFSNLWSIATWQHVQSYNLKPLSYIFTPDCTKIPYLYNRPTLTQLCI